MMNNKMSIFCFPGPKHSWNKQSCQSMPENTSASYFLQTKNYSCICVRRWSMENIVKEFQIYGDTTQL